jgi:hypothetical protein
MLKVANINISDDYCGSFVIKLKGQYANLFSVIDRGLYLVQPITQPGTYSVTVSVEDFASRFTPKTTNYTLTVTPCPTTTTTTTTTTEEPFYCYRLKTTTKCPIGDCISGIYIAGKSGDTCWNINEVNSHLFFSDYDYANSNTMTIKGLGIVGPQAHDNSSIENIVSYNGQNIVINTDNKPKSAVIRTSSPNCVSISGIGTRNTGSGQGWTHPFTTDIDPNPFNACSAADPPTTIGGQGAYTLVISDIDPSGEYEVHLRLGASTQSPLFDISPGRCGSYFYAIGDNNGLGGTISDFASQTYPILGCGDGPMIETQIIENLQNYAAWNKGGDCVVWLAEGWVVDRNDICETCRLKPENTDINILVNGAGSGVILEAVLDERAETDLDDNGCLIPYWVLSDISVVNGGSGYSNCETISFSFSGDVVRDFNETELVGTVFVGTKEPVNANIIIYDPDPFNIRNGGAILEPIWNLTGDIGQSSFNCGINNLNNIWSYNRKVYEVIGFNILSGGSGYEVDDIIEIDSINNENQYSSIFYGLTGCRVSSVDINGSILSISIVDGGAFGGVPNGIIEKVEFALYSPPSSFVPGNLNLIKPHGKFYKIASNCAEITGPHPTFDFITNDGGFGANFDPRVVRRGCPEYFALKDISILNGGSGYYDGQPISIIPDSGYIEEQPAFGIIYVDSEEPKNPTISFQNGFYYDPDTNSVVQIDATGVGAIIEPIFTPHTGINGLPYAISVDNFDEVGSTRPYNQCNYIPSPRKTYVLSGANIIDGGIGYASGITVGVTFNSTNDGTIVYDGTNNGISMTVTSTDSNGSITSLGVGEQVWLNTPPGGPNQVYGGSLTDSIGSILLYDNVGYGCTSETNSFSTKDHVGIYKSI